MSRKHFTEQFKESTSCEGDRFVPRVRPADVNRESAPVVRPAVVTSRSNHFQNCSTEMEQVVGGCTSTYKERKQHHGGLRIHSSNGIPAPPPRGPIRATELGSTSVSRDYAMAQ